MSDSPLVHFDAAREALERSVRVDEVKTIRNKAQAAQAYLRQAKASLVMQNQCAEIKLRAERRLGEMLSQTVPHHGGRPKRSRDATVSRPTLDSLGVTKSQSSRWQRIADIPSKRFENYLTEAKSATDGEEITTAGLLRAAGRQATVDAMASSESFEWYTPTKYVEPARTVMGGIDLDPASTAEANEAVRAKKIYTLGEDGLTHEWSGRVWLNPPYGFSRDKVSNQSVWSAALLDRFAAGDVQQAVLLVNAATDAGWFRRLWGCALCFVDHRIRFNRPGQTSGPQPTHGNVLAYLGRRTKSFQQAFSDLGRIVLPAGDSSRAI